MGFRPDNLRMSPDGLVIFAAGHGNFQTPQETSNVAKIDPETLEVQRVFQHPSIEGFAASTTAIQIGNEIWLGTNRGEMIAYFPGARVELPRGRDGWAEYQADPPSHRCPQLVRGDQRTRAGAIAHASFSRYCPRLLPNRQPPRRRRDGRGLQGHRHPPEKTMVSTACVPLGRGTRHSPQRRTNSRPWSSLDGKPTSR